MARVSSRLRQLARDRRGVAALEFALVAPLLLILYMGGTEASLAVTLHRKLQDTAATISDLSTQNDQITRAELNGLANVARDIMRPYDASRLGLLIQGIDIAPSGQAKVVWSFAQNTAAPAKNASYTLGSDYAALRDTFIVVTTARFSYQPLGGYGWKTPIDMSREVTFRARGKKGVRCDDC